MSSVPKMGLFTEISYSQVYLSFVFHKYYLFSEYLCFQRIEKLDYTFPPGFHERGKLLIEALLKKNVTERLGAGRKE